MDKNTTPPPAPRDVKIDTAIDLKNHIVTFTESSVNGIVSLNPTKMHVPLNAILMIAAQATIAMLGGAPGQAAKVTGNAGPGPKLVGS